MDGYLQRHLTPLVFAAAAMTSLVAGTVAARGGPLAGLLLLGLAGLGGLAVLLSISPQTLFLGWLFLAPLFQNAAEHSANPIGAPLTTALYTLPAVVLAGLAFFSPRRGARLSAVDYLPAVFLAYWLVVIVLTSNALHETPKVVFTHIVLGPVIFYFLRRGAGARIPHEKIITTLMLAAIVQAVLGVVNLTVGWNLWGDHAWEEGGHTDFPRAVATLSNPGVLGMFLGVAIVAAVAILSWDGPRSRRRLAIITLLACIPGLATTMTRGPMLGVVLTVVLVLVLGRWRLPSIVGMAAVAAVIVALFPIIRSTDLYEGRFAEQTNITSRAALQDWSLKLAAQKPVLGWGHGSFDEAKNTSTFDVQGLNIALVREYTSHDTYLTILVELGGLGLLLFALPFVVLGASGVSRARAPEPERWILVTALGSLLVIALSGGTFDLRFFSFIQVLPWIFLAILASRLARPPAPAAG